MRITRFKVIDDESFEDTILNEKYYGLKSAIDLLNGCDSENTELRMRLDFIYELMGDIESKVKAIILSKYE